MNPILNKEGHGRPARDCPRDKIETPRHGERRELRTLCFSVFRSNSHFFIVHFSA